MQLNRVRRLFGELPRAPRRGFFAVHDKNRLQPGPRIFRFVPGFQYDSLCSFERLFVNQIVEVALMAE